MPLHTAWWDAVLDKRVSEPTTSARQAVYDRNTLGELEETLGLSGKYRLMQSTDECQTWEPAPEAMERALLHMKIRVADEDRALRVLDGVLFDPQDDPRHPDYKPPKRSRLSRLLRP